jgi:hypothetical protein
LAKYQRHIARYALLGDVNWLNLLLNWLDYQVLVANGYVVLYLSPQGSTGYGGEFAEAITGNWGNLDYIELWIGLIAIYPN